MAAAPENDERDDDNTNGQCRESEHSLPKENRLQVDWKDSGGRWGTPAGLFRLRQRRKYRASGWQFDRQIDS
jgi:hypothetical protein